MALVIAHVKIQFEINSQLIKLSQINDHSCDCSRKNTIWNQFTTNLLYSKSLCFLWLLT